jgi:hypothetical protein
MLKNISIKEYDNYVSDTYLFKMFLENKPNKGINKTENYKKLLLKIESVDIAKDIFEFMTGEEQKDIYLVYSSVKNHDLTELATKYYRFRRGIFKPIRYNLENGRRIRI